MDLDGGKSWYGWKVLFHLERRSGFLFHNEHAMNIICHMEMDVRKGFNLIFIHLFPHLPSLVFSDGREAERTSYQAEIDVQSKGTQH